MTKRQWNQSDGPAILGIMLRAGADAIEIRCPSMNAHGRLMREAAAEVDRLAAELKAATDTLVIALRQNGEAAR